jgi:hypothetical protein
MGCRGEATAIAIAESAGNAKRDWPIKTGGLHAGKCKFANFRGACYKRLNLGVPARVAALSRENQ